MDLDIIKSALQDALNLLSSECESLCNEDLEDDYNEVIASIEKALSELEVK